MEEEAKKIQEIQEQARYAQVKGGMDVPSAVSHLVEVPLYVWTLAFCDARGAV